MKLREWARWPAALAAAALLPVFGFGQQIIENPENPVAKNAGRVLELREVWRVSDDGQPFYFSGGGQLEVAGDGSLFLRCSGDQFLKFSPEGRFIRNIFKRGQGPGELQRQFAFHADDKDLFVLDYEANRLSRFDLEGNFIDSANLGAATYSSFLGIRADTLVFTDSVWPPAKERTGKFMDILYHVKYVTKSGIPKRTVHTFRAKTYLAPNAAMSWDRSIETLSRDGKRIYGFHGREYAIEVLDLETERITQRWTRKYPRVEHVEQNWEAEFRKRYGRSKIEFDPDIEELIPNKDQLWARTSTRDKINGYRYDVFNEVGKFIDSFYLGPDRLFLYVDGSEIFIMEKGADEIATFVKYEITGGR